MLFKLLVNAGTVLLACWALFLAIYFRVFPRFLGNYRKVVKRGREYDKEIDKIHKKKDQA